MNWSLSYNDCVWFYSHQKTVYAWTDSAEKRGILVGIIGLIVESFFDEIICQKIKLIYQLLSHEFSAFW